MNTHTALHEKAKGLAKQYLSHERELITVLMEMEETKSFLNLGYTQLFHYCRGELHFSESQAGYFSNVAKKSQEVPALKEAIDTGKLTVSQARRIVPVITPSTQAVWIERAANLKQRELEKQVALVNPRSVQERMKAVDWDRYEMKLGLSEKTRAKLEKAIALVSKKKGKVSSIEETLDVLLDTFLQKKDPVEKAKRASLRKTKPSPPRPGRQIPARVKHQVNLRDQGQCQTAGCTNHIWTELHHKIPVAQRGPNTPDNLITLCSAHHALVHQDRRAESSVERRSLPGNANLRQRRTVE